ncbi:MAG TPA: bifunctional metallophosphatase/5'-nucleotidase [Polyangiaceae bacterium]|jgi:5'-nucleotidase
MKLVLLATVTALSLAACARAPEQPAPAHTTSSPALPPLTVDPIAATPATYTLTLLHTNDVHSRFDPLKEGEGPAVGGVLQRKAAIDRVRHERGDDHVLLVDAGDFSVGTVWDAVWGRSAEIAVMNALGYDVITPGNHEFDEGPALLAFALGGGVLKVAGVEHRMGPFEGKVVASNVEFEDPAQGEFVLRHAVRARGGTRVGFVGAVTEQAVEMPAVHGVKVHPYVESVQREVDELTAQGVKEIVLISHCGTAVDKANAEKLTGVDVIVSGHDHAFLGDLATLKAGGLSDAALKKLTGPYPMHVKAKDGHDVLLVSAGSWGRALGRLDLTFDSEGHVIESGGAPIVLRDEPDAARDPALVKLLAELRAPVDARGGELLTNLPHDLAPAPEGQTELGAVFAEGMLAAAKKEGAVAALAEGDARNALPAGPLTYGKLFEAFPFALNVQVVEVSGEDLLHIVAHGLGAEEPPLQLAGMTARVVRGKPEEDAKVVELKIGGKPVSPKGRYTIAVDEYVGAGMDGFTWFKGAKGKSLPMRVVDAAAAELRAHGGKVMGAPLAQRVVEVRQ